MLEHSFEPHSEAYGVSNVSINFGLVLHHLLSCRKNIVERRQYHPSYEYRSQLMKAVSVHAPGFVIQRLS